MLFRRFISANWVLKEAPSHGWEPAAAGGKNTARTRGPSRIYSLATSGGFVGSSLSLDPCCCPCKTHAICLRASCSCRSCKILQLSLDCCHLTAGMSTNKSSCKNGILNRFWRSCGGCQWNEMHTQRYLRWPSQYRTLPIDLSRWGCCASCSSSCSRSFSKAAVSIVPVTHAIAESSALPDVIRLAVIVN